MVSNRVLATVLFGCLGAVALAFMATPASALITFTGDWVISGSQSYSDETIVVQSTNATDGQIHILTTGALSLENCTVIIPNNRILDNEGTLTAGNSTFDGPNFQLYLRGPASIWNTRIINATFDSGGRQGTWVTSPGVSFTNVSWTRAAGRAMGLIFVPIHLRTVMDFQGNYPGLGSTVYYDLAVISGTAAIDVSGNTFTGQDTFGQRSTALLISSVQHTGSVTYNIHDNVFTSNDYGIDLQAASPSTTYSVWNNSFTITRNIAIEVGDNGNSRFAGNLSISDCNITTRNIAGIALSGGIRVFGALNSPPTVNVQRVTIGGPGDGVIANSATVVVWDSQFTGNGTFYNGGTDGHILAYNTFDSSANSATSGARGSVEHMAFLNITSMEWQNSVAIVGDNVVFLNATGAISLALNPQNWTPSYQVWWGRYQGAPFVDNRNLLPVIDDGPRTFACAPSQFFFTETMTALDILCTDDAPPTLSLLLPPVGLTWQNTSDLPVAGDVDDLGAGLLELAWSFDNNTFTPVALPGPGTTAFSFNINSVADGRYTLYLRSTDRVGLHGFVLRGPFNIDTAAPSLSLPVLPEHYFGSFFTLQGTSEPFSNVTFLAAGGQTATAQVAANGSFRLTLPLDEGLNVFTLRAYDLAGNSQTVVFTILVDSVPPVLAVLLDAVTYTNRSTLTVAGLTEPGAVVMVNGVSAALVDLNFSLDYALTPGFNALAVTSSDAAGNTATWVGAAWYDDQPPQLTVVISTGNATEDGTPVTRQGQVSVTGQVVDNLPNNIASVVINGTSVAFDGEGQFIYSAPVVEGTNLIPISTTDKVGNTRRVTMQVIRDSTSPTAVATLEAGDGNLTVLGSATYTRGNSVVVVILMSEDGVATVFGQTHAVTAGENRFTIDLLEGTNNVLVSYKDRAGNSGTPQGVTVVRDTSAPVVVITAPVFGTVINEEVVVIEGTAEAGAVVKVNGLAASVNTAGGFSKSMPLDPGQNTFTITASDAFGNTNTTTIQVTRAQGTVSTSQGDITLPILLLVIGLGAGAGIGFMLRGKGRASEVAKAAPDAAPAEAPSEPEPDMYAQDSAQYGGPRPKGPRGPMPP